MLNAYALNDGKLDKLTFDPTHGIPDRAVWIDLFAPTAEEKTAAVALTAIDIPSEADLNVLSDTERLYRENGNVYLEFTVIHRGPTGFVDISDLGFILAGARLVTVRYADPLPITKFATAYARKPCIAPTAMGILTGLLESFVGRIGEYVEANSVELYTISRQVFASRKPGGGKTPDLEAVLDRLGTAGDINAKARDSLASIGRLLAFGAEDLEAMIDKPTRNALRAVRRDAVAVSDYANFVAGQLTFVLDAVLGLITVEQNRIIKIFSVVATLFIPPTLFASLWGMNFKHMPELDWSYGYPFALVTIVLSAVLPYLFFRWRGWL